MTVKYLYLAEKSPVSKTEWAEYCHMTAAKTQLYVRSSTKTLNARKNPLNLLSRGKRDFLEQCKNICMQNIEKKVSLEYYMNYYIRRFFSIGLLFYVFLKNHIMKLLSLVFSNL